MKLPISAVAAVAAVATSLLGQAPELPVAPSSPLEFRVLADHSTRGATLREDRKRLQKWLQGTATLQLLRANPNTVRRFNLLAVAAGGPLRRDIAWIPHAVRQSSTTPGMWGHAFCRDATTEVLAVPLFSEAEYAAGPTVARAQLVELLAVDMRERWFDGRDVDASRLRVDEVEGQPALAYELLESRRGAFRGWTKRLETRYLALIVGGTIRMAPRIGAAHTGWGKLTGGLTKAELDALASDLRGAATTVVRVPDRSASGLPAGADSEDLRAMRGAQAMLDAEKKLRGLIRAGKIVGLDRILTFEEIESWPYEDGLLGMPKALNKLDGQKVLMTGFMLPINEVENIQEFLLVGSLWSCHYGQMPDINGLVRVVMQGDARIDYQFEPLKVTGTFGVEATMEDGYCVDIFQLHAKSVSVIE